MSQAQERRLRSRMSNPQFNYTCANETNIKRLFNRTRKELIIQAAKLATAGAKKRKVK